MTVEEIEADAARTCDTLAAEIDEAWAKAEEAEARADALEEELRAFRLALATGVEGTA